MQHIDSESGAARKFAAKSRVLAATALFLCMLGCGNGIDNTKTPPTQTKQGPQTYFAPYVAGVTNGDVNVSLTGPEIYTIDDVANKFTQSTFQLQLPAQQGPQVINVGVDSAGPRGLLKIGLTTNYALSSGRNSFIATPYDPPKAGSFAIELAGQAGGLVQVTGQPVIPVVATDQCPTLKTAQSYWFMTIPAGLSTAVPGRLAAAWNPTTDTAYGSVDITSDGENVTFSNIHQFTLPSTGGTGAPMQSPSAAVAGICGPTVFGNTTTLGQLMVTAPQPGNSSATPPQASVGIGSTGLLVEHNGAGDASVIFPGTSPGLFYDNTLGAGTGAVGLPKPSSALGTSSLVGAQYLGFVYGAGVYSGTPGTPPTGWSSHLASFGFSSPPSSCASVAASGNTLIYGGDFTNDIPTTNGFGNCDLAVDLGVQDNSNNGLFPKATVWLGANYAANSTKKTYSFPAVAIAGQLNGKYAIFLLGVDATQPWAIYLMQSN